MTQPEAPAGPASGGQPSDRWWRAPFTPAGVTFRPVHPNLAKARLYTGLPWLVVPALVGVALLAVGLATDVRGLVVAGAITFCVFLLLAMWVVLLVPRQVAAIGYAEAADDLVIRKGILFKHMSIVPYGRMQFVDVHQGPVDRALGISKVKLHTASASTDALLPGLPAEEATRLRDRLTERGEARLAGL